MVKYIIVNICWCFIIFLLLLLLLINKKNLGTTDFNLLILVLTIILSFIIKKAKIVVPA